ncbi:MAG: hypothetical protein ING75_17410 [Rhodocyclaceae bacterium]|nr:hypothetical protein [Rhodocyclaceae bacterium]
MKLTNFSFWCLNVISALFGGMAIAGIGYGVLATNIPAVPAVVAVPALLYGVWLCAKSGLNLRYLANIAGEARHSTQRSDAYLHGFRYGNGNWSLLVAVFLVGTAGICFIQAAHTQIAAVALAAFFAGVSLRCCAAVLIIHVKAIGMRLIERDRQARRGPTG